MNTIQKTMKAIAINSFGGPETLSCQNLAVPTIGANDVLIHVKFAGIGVWDPFECSGGYAEMLGLETNFPYVPGSEGSGTVAAVGKDVTKVKKGDRVYGVRFLNPVGGFYAEYVAVDAEYVSFCPGDLTDEQCAVMGGVGITALRGLEDILKLQKGESILIVGASGGIGHMAVQLARKMGARILAVASGRDGMELAKRLGADMVVDGHRDDVLASARSFQPDGVDTALITVGGRVAGQSLQAIRKGGRVAYPIGVQPVPKNREGLQITGYYGDVEPEIIARFVHFTKIKPFYVQVSKVFSMKDVSDAHRALDSHYTGKLAIRMQ